MSVLKDTLKIYHTYAISNAVVNDTPPKHRVIDNDHQWLLYGRTPIEEVEVKSLTIRALKYNFVPLAALSEHTNSTEGIGTNLTAKLKQIPSTSTNLIQIIHTKNRRNICCSQGWHS